MDDNPKEKPQIRYYTRPRDESLQAYKDWINGMVQALNPNAKDEMTEQEWERDWKAFWLKVTQGPSKK